MQDTPAGWPRFSSAIVYRDAAATIDWLCDAFGFGIRIKVEGENGRIEHCELEYGDGLIMIAQESPNSPRPWMRSLRSPHPRGTHDSRLRQGPLGGSKLCRSRSGRAHLVGGAAPAQRADPLKALKCPA
jgi:hypothetical protein